MMVAADHIKGKKHQYYNRCSEEFVRYKMHQEETEFLVWFTISNRCKSWSMNFEHQDGQKFDEFETLCQSKW